MAFDLLNGLIKWNDFVSFNRTRLSKNILQKKKVKKNRLKPIFEFSTIFKNYHITTIELFGIKLSAIEKKEGEGKGERKKIRGKEGEERKEKPPLF